MKTTNSDVDWIDGYIRKTLTEAEKAYVTSRLTGEPDFIVLYAERKRLIEGAKFIYISDKLRELQVNGGRAMPDYDDFPVYLDMPTEEIVPESVLLVSEGGQAHHQIRLSHAWKRWAVAATVAIVTSVYMLVLTKQPPRPMDCLVSISSLNTCF